MAIVFNEDFVIHCRDRDAIVAQQCAKSLAGAPVRHVPEKLPNQDRLSAAALVVDLGALIAEVVVERPAAPVIRVAGTAFAPAE